jgi:hypothetical protein
MARTKPTAINANPVPRKGHATAPKPATSRPAPDRNQVKKPGKQGTQQQPIPSNPVTAGRVKKGQAKPISKANGRVPKKPARVHRDNWDFDPDQEYKIRGIMAERKGEYKIKWAGKDSAGDDFVDTWVPRSFANNLAKLDWALRKEQNRRRSFNDSDSEEEGGHRKRKRTKPAKTKTAKTTMSTKAGIAKAKGKK